MLVNVVHALLLLGSWEAIRGVGVWVKTLRGQTPPWIVAAEAQAKSRYVYDYCTYHVSSYFLHCV